MKIGLKLVGDIAKDMRQFDSTLERACTGGVKEATAGLKGSLRDQVRAAGFKRVKSL